MAAFDAGSHLTGNSVSTLSWTHTPVGTPSGIYLGIFSRRSASVVGDQPSSAPTYGGTSMTLVGTVSDGTSLIRWTWYYLPSPASGAQTVSVTFGGTSQLGCGGVAYSVTGDSGANPSASLASAAGNSTSASVTPVAPGATDLVLFAGSSNTASSGFTTGAGMSSGQVQVFVDNTGNNDWDADYRPGASGSAALTHAVTTGTWFASTINVPGAVASNFAITSGLPLSLGIGFTPFVGQTYDNTPSQTSFDTGAPPVPAPLRQGIFGALVGQVVPNDIGSAGGGLTDTFSFSTTGASAPSFTLAGMTDTFTVSTTGTSTPAFTMAGMTDTFVLATTGKSTPAFVLAGMTDRFTFATTGTSTPVFTLAGMTDTFVVSTTGKSAPVFTLAGMSDVFSFASTGKSAPTFTLAGMSDVFALATTGVSTPAFAVVSLAGGGVVDVFTFASTGVSTTQFGLIFFALNREGDRVSREAGLGLGSMYEYANYSTATSAALAEHSRVNAGVGLGAGSHIDFTNAAAKTDETTTEGNRVKDLAGIGGGSQANL